MKVKVTDVVIRTREVELPDECPRCGCDLTKPGAVIATQLDYSLFDAVLTNGRFEPHQTDPWDTFPGGYPPSLYSFSACLEVVLSGREAVLEEPPESCRQRTVWSAGIDKLVANPEYHS